MPSCQQVKRRGVVGRPRKIWNNVLLSDAQSLNMRRPYSVAQSQSAWKAKTVMTHTKLMLEDVLVMNCCAIRDVGRYMLSLAFLPAG